MSNDRTQKTEEEKPIQIDTEQLRPENSNETAAEVDNMKLTALRAYPITISLALLIPGILSLIFSIISNSQVLSFIGLGLTFWGALFLFVRPTRYVESSLLVSTSASTYATVDRIMKDLKPKGKSYYVPPYPEEVYLPDHLKGLKDMVVFISQNSEFTMPSIEEIAKGKFMLKNPEGTCISPPGAALLTQFEKHMKTDITKLELTELCETLSRLVIEQFQMAKEIEIKPEENGAHITITDSIYARLYNDEYLKSVHLLGCPLASAIACAIAKTTGKVVTIQKDRILPENKMIEVWLRIVKG